MRGASLFAGIGGGSLSMKMNGIEVVWANERDKFACQTYRANHPDTKLYECDIYDLDLDELEPVDIISAGFPCQPFSLAGKRKGLEDPRGNVFWRILEIVRHLKTPILKLENVKGILSQAGGETFRIIVDALENEGYTVEWKVLNSRDFGLPQNRERIFIICYREGVLEDFEFPTGSGEHADFRDYVESEVDEKYYYDQDDAIFPELVQAVTRKDTVYQYRRTYVRANRTGVIPTLTANMGTGGHNVPIILTDDDRIRKLTPVECARVQGFPYPVIVPKKLGEILEDVVDPKYTLSDRMWDFLKRHKEKHRIRGNGFGYSIFTPDDIFVNTITARYGKDGAELLVEQEGANPRRLTPRECARLQGFYDSFKIPVSDTQAYKQFGNTVSIPVAFQVVFEIRLAYVKWIQV